ncbi:roadblock/LC7 domain-containing protein [Micromonospora sp. WMMD882]|uniref:roadblock/LC7 domain-containing protein n=1 Tax=Micromonospora sp. WMMD882 TaxID=3015151 RepID=UPI00248B0AFF|nr:roadblock/LC7 domain-containing protein [Micromonospora sp. WMMD882]WBB79714.1 roadblock/LC7 domain-containing protein [Micromonospora sp. WMMD882]
MDADALIDAELRLLRAGRPEVSGVVLAGTDGLLVASDLTEPAATHLAALAAASFGLGQRFALAVEQGEFREQVVRTTAGHVVVHPAGGHALLVLVVGAQADPGALREPARAAAGRVGEIVDAHRVGYAVPTPVVPRPLVTRTPMATVPRHLLRAAPAWRRPPV